MSLTIGKVLAGLVAALSLLAAFLTTYNVKVAVAPVEPAYGSVTGPDVYVPLFLHQGVTIGGNVNSSSTVATETLAASDINNYKLLNAKAAAAATLTLPTKAALTGIGFVPVAGDTAEWFIHASTSAITLAGNTGVTLRSATTTVVGIGQTDKLTFVRLPANEGATIEVYQTGN